MCVRVGLIVAQFGSGPQPGNVLAARFQALTSYTNWFTFEHVSFIIPALLKLLKIRHISYLNSALFLIIKIEHVFQYVLYINSTYLRSKQGLF